jgi:hypothetical protein
MQGTAAHEAINTMLHGRTRHTIRNRSDEVPLAEWTTVSDDGKQHCINLVKSRNEGTFDAAHRVGPCTSEVSNLTTDTHVPHASLPSQYRQVVLHRPWRHPRVPCESPERDPWGGFHRGKEQQAIPFPTRRPVAHESSPAA